MTALGGQNWLEAEIGGIMLRAELRARRRITVLSLISIFGYINFHLYQHLFWPRFSPMSHNLDSVISRFIYINVYYRNRQVDISETEVYIDNVVTVRPRGSRVHSFFSKIIDP